MPTPTLPKTLPPERSVDLLSAPIYLHLPTIYILINCRHPLAHLLIRLLALLEYLEHQITTDSRVVGVAKVLVDSLLEGFDTLAYFFGVVGVD